MLVDPQGQGLQDKKREEVNAMKVTTLNDKNFRNHLEDCCPSASPCLSRTSRRSWTPCWTPS